MRPRSFHRPTLTASAKEAAHGLRNPGQRKGLGRGCSSTSSSHNDSSISESLSNHRHTEIAVPSSDRFSWKLRKEEAEIRLLSRECTRVDGCRNIDDGLLWAALDGRADGWCSPFGRAYVAVSRQGRIEILIHPEERGKGVGRLLMERGLERLSEWGCTLARTWAYGDRARTVDWLASLGFQSERVLYLLSRPFTRVSPPFWEHGWSVQAFQPDDAQDWHSLHSSLQVDPSSAWSLEALRRQLQQPETPGSEFWLLRESDRLRGYLWLKGREIFLFALDPEVRGRGLGEKLLSWGLSRLRTEAIVYCDDQRSGALSLYRKFGFEEISRDRCLKRLSNK